MSLPNNENCRDDSQDTSLRGNLRNTGFLALLLTPFKHITKSVCSNLSKHFVQCINFIIFDGGSGNNTSLSDKNLTETKSKKADISQKNSSRGATGGKDVRAAIDRTVHFRKQNIPKRETQFLQQWLRSTSRRRGAALMMSSTRKIISAASDADRST